jgi:DNA-3-methyladenine glycosylase II
VEFPVDHRPALKHLKKTDRVLKQLIDHLGACTLSSTAGHDDLVALLIRSIVYQRISLAAAATVHQRFYALYPEGFPSPTQIVETPDEALRAIGLPAAKVAYIKDVAANALVGLPAMAELETWSDEEIIDRLIQIKGIGRWSVEMLLIFQLQRWDVLPVADLGLQMAMRDCYQLPTKPTAKMMQEIGEKWRPYRSIATWYLWRSRDLENQKLLVDWS